MSPVTWAGKASLRRCHFFVRIALRLSEPSHLATTKWRADAFAVYSNRVTVTRYESQGKLEFACPRKDENGSGLSKQSHGLE
jgi:hypothetical protein